MTNLIDLLKSETASLKAQYLTLTGEWAVTEFAHICERANKPYPKYEALVQPSGQRTAPNGHSYYFIDHAGQKAYRNAVSRRELANKIMEAGQDAYVAKALEAAAQHYEDSIIKLAARIEKKQLDQQSISIKTSHIGVNIETVLTDGVQTVKAWTIIASGAVQRPHYRYLVK